MIQNSFKIILLLIIFSCSSSKYFKNSGKYSNLEDDEKNLWELSRKEQKKINSSDFYVTDQVLEKYLNKVLFNVLDTLKNNNYKFEVKVINNPFLNAFTFPNGVIYIHTGLISELDNESQLATILAHEVSHALLRHSIRGKRSAETTASIFSIISIASIGAGAIANTFTNIFGSLSANLAISGHSKSLETEADNYGFSLLKNAGYDINESVKVFQKLLAYSKKRKNKEPFFFGTHPTLKSRIKNFQKQIKNHKNFNNSRKTSSKRFLNFKQRVLILNTKSSIQFSFFGQAKKNCEAYLKIDSLNPEAFYLLAKSELGLENDSTAIRHYKKALIFEPTHEESLIELGHFYFKKNNFEKAKHYYSKYNKLCRKCDKKSYSNYYLKKME